MEEDAFAEGAGELLGKDLLRDDIWGETDAIQQLVFVILLARLHTVGEQLADLEDGLVVLLAGDIL